MEGDNVLNDFERQLETKEKIIFEQRAELNKARVENKVLRDLIEQGLGDLKQAQALFNDLQKMFTELQEAARRLKEDADKLKENFNQP